MWRNRILASVSPIDRAASTNSRSRNDRTSPRASLAISAQPVRANIKISRTAARVGRSSSGKAARAASISISVGSASIESAAPIRTV